LTDDPWTRKQRYLPDSTICETTFTNDRDGFEVKATDFVLPNNDALVRVFEVVNKNLASIDTSFLYYNDFDIAETPIGDACYYDQKSDTIVSYKRNYWFAFGGERRSSAHQCGVHEEGSDAFVDAKDGELWGNSLALYSGTRGVNSCLKWDLGTLNPGVKEQLVLLMCFAHNKQDALFLIDTARKSSLPEMVNDVNIYCQDWLRKAQVVRVPEAWEDLLRRSLLTLRTLVSPDFGGIVAAPTLEPDYRYVWSRDGTYVAYALDRCGYHKDAEAFYRWCKDLVGHRTALRVDEESGFSGRRLAYHKERRRTSFAWKGPGNRSCRAVPGPLGREECTAYLHKLGGIRGLERECRRSVCPRT
jgi:GH15 family glucan-1,4-alpha-glucosidase